MISDIPIYHKRIGIYCKNSSWYVLKFMKNEDCTMMYQELYVLLGPELTTI